MAAHLFKVLFPSWRFFDDSGHDARLFYRFGAGESELGPWLPFAQDELPRSLFSLFLNARGNLALACHSLIDQLIEEIEARDARQIASSVSYELVGNLVRGYVAPGRFQFKISVGADDALISGIHEA